MAVNLEQILKQLEVQVVIPPSRTEVALAVIDDHLRDLGLSPLGMAEWEKLGALTEPFSSYLAFLSFAITDTSLGAGARAHSPLSLSSPSSPLISTYLDQLSDIPPSAVPQNRFRREEMVRKWLALLGLSVEGESSADSKSRLSRLDSSRMKRVMEEQEEQRKSAWKSWHEAVRKAQEQQRGNYE